MTAGARAPAANLAQHPLDRRQTAGRFASARPRLVRVNCIPSLDKSRQGRINTSVGYEVEAQFRIR